MTSVSPAANTAPSGASEVAVQHKEWQALDLCHQQVLETLDDLRHLCAHLEAKGVDETASALAKRIGEFFSHSARQHHADEERIVFPDLLQSGDAKLVEQVQRLQQDHGWLEEDWLVLAPPLEAIANGYSWYDLDMLRSALPVFADLYLDHIDLEESLIYPEAKRRLADRAEVGQGRRLSAERRAQA